MKMNQVTTAGLADGDEAKWKSMRSVAGAGDVASSAPESMCVGFLQADEAPTRNHGPRKLREEETTNGFERLPHKR